MHALNETTIEQAPGAHSDSHMGYMMAVRNFAIRQWFPQIAGDIMAKVEKSGLPPVMSVDEYQTLAPVVDDDIDVKLWKRVMRSQQQMTWQRLFEAYGEDREGWLALLDEAEKKNPDHLHLDAQLDVPDSARYDIHLQPGGYCNDPLAGYVFDHGTRVFYQGDNDGEALHQGYAEAMRVPADGNVKRVLDLGCSIGQCTTAIKERFESAEVWGLDIALPLLRHAHLRATALGSDVHFQHGLAEDLKFEDGSFDAVFAYILFHETPEHTFEPILKEALRVLRPGGTLTIVDAPNGERLAAPNRMWLAYDARYNCEPYSPAFVATDIAAMVERMGFEDVEHGPTPTFLSQTLGTKPS